MPGHRPTSAPFRPRRPWIIHRSWCRRWPSWPEQRTPTKHKAFLHDASATQIPPARAALDQYARSCLAIALGTWTASFAEIGFTGDELPTAEKRRQLTKRLSKKPR